MSRTMRDAPLSPETGSATTSSTADRLAAGTTATTPGTTSTGALVLDERPDTATTVGLVPLGYADGVPRHAGNRAEVGVAGHRRPVRGRICMDQFVIDLAPASSVEIGEDVTLFGPGLDGEPTAAEWAEWCDTIGYEIVTRVGARVPRVHR